MAEPDAAGGGRFSASTTSTTKGLFGRQKSSTTNFSGFGVDIPGIKQLTTDLQSVTGALHNLKQTLNSMSSSFMAGPIVNTLAQISRAAQTTTQNLSGLSSTMGGMRAGGGGGGGGGARFASPPPGSGNSTSPNAGFATQMSQNAGSYNSMSGQMGGAATGMAASIGGAINGATSGLVNSLPILGPIAGGIMNFAGDLGMMPMRFARERINTNRAASLKMTQDLTPYQWTTGKDNVADLMWSLKNIPGAMKGDVADILGAVTTGRRVGAQYGFGDKTATGRYGEQFYSAIGQFQQIAPGMGAGQMANIVGGSLSNTQANQAAAFYTGGAFSMIKGKGGMKSPSEWAEGIYNWLKNQRPGRDRGKDFDYGGLLAQNFPGSNINAWFQTVGVSPEMQEFWWTWALAKTKMNVSGDKVFAAMGGDGGKLESNQAWRRAAAVTATSRNEFGLAGQMAGQYATRERSNLWYNQAMGAAVNRMIPGMANSPFMKGIQYLPDEVENFLWNTLESSGPLAQLIGGGIMGWGATASAVAPMATAGAGDIGDYGAMGATSTAGLTPDVRRKVDAMMRANPRLKVTSGLRDKHTSAKLAKKGIGHFGSGLPFMGGRMGDIGDGRKANGHGTHSGGWAADLGPRSEYGWIQRNAHKFGLQTGAGKGEPWHVQNAGTVGDVGDVPFVGGFLDAIPGGGIVNGLWDFGSGVIDGMKAIGQLLQQVFDAFKTLGGMATGGGFLDPGSMQGNAADVIGKKTTQFMEMMGLSGAAGQQADVRIGYDKGLGAGLPTEFNLGTSWKGGGPGAGGMTTPGLGGGGGSVANILQKYAGNNTVEAKSYDAATKQRMLVALHAAQAAGLSGDELVAAVSLAGRESNFNPRAHNGNRGTGDDSYGLWQINMLGAMGESRRKSLGISSNDELYDPNVNAKAMKQLFDGNKTPFYAWGPYKGQAPLFGGAEDWVPAVYSVAKEAGMVGDIGMEYQAAGGGTRVSNIQFNNTFHIQGGTTGAGGMDIGRIVPIMADRLEEEMKKRLAVQR